MRSIDHTTRWLITVGLMLSLGLTGLFPQMMVWSDSGKVVSALNESAQQESQCCCGTEEGRCCGLGCCMAPGVVVVRCLQNAYFVYHVHPVPLKELALICSGWVKGREL